MANWAYIENNKIVETFDSLPQNFKNISNLSASENDLDFLKSLGWYQIQHEEVSYDINTQNLLTIGIIFDGDGVLEKYKVVDISKETLYKEFMAKLRETRDKKLKDSDFMCCYDIIEKKGQEFAELLKNYRQQLRDLPLNYPFNGTVYNYHTVIWPNKPDLNTY